MRAGPREEKEPHCPFCGTVLIRPHEIDFMYSKAMGGTCSCGALYVVDPTGKNVGEIMSYALVLTAEKLAKDISALEPEKDYQDAILSYDWRLHRSFGKSQGYMDGRGRLYIIQAKTQKT